MGGHQLTGLGPGGLGPPACRATMIWSTDRTVRAASVASLMAQSLEASRSRMPSSVASRMPSLLLFYDMVSIKRQAIVISDVATTYLDVNAGIAVLALVVGSI